jgi:hypothetical protein
MEIYYTTLYKLSAQPSLSKGIRNKAAGQIHYMIGFEVFQNGDYERSFLLE